MAASALSVQIFTEKILPHLGPSETSVLSRLCKPAREVIEAQAKKPQKTFDFKKPRASWTPGTIPALIAHKWMMQIFTRRPDLLGSVRNGNERPRIAKLAFDCKEGKLTQEQLENDFASAVADDDPELLKTVFFHPKAKEMSDYDFFKRAEKAILSEKPALLRMILKFPGAAKLSGNEHLGNLLWRAVHKNSLEIVKLVLTLPNAKDIHGGGVDGLAWALGGALENHELEIAGLIAALPNAKDIPANGDISISKILFVILTLKKATLKEVRFLLTLAEAKFIAPEGESYSLGHLLLYAVKTGNLEIVQEFLAHRNTPLISSKGYGSIGGSMKEADSGGFPDIFVELANHYIGSWSYDWVSTCLKNAIEANATDLVERIFKLKGIETYPIEDYFKYYRLAVEKRRTILALKFLNCNENRLLNCFKQIVIQDSAACMKFFLDSSAADTMTMEGDYSLKAILQIAASWERPKLVTMILDSNRIPSKQLPAMVRHAFETARAEKNRNVVEELLSHRQIYNALSIAEINEARIFAYN